MSAEGNRRAMVTFSAPGIVWMAILGNVQLGLRHPENKGPSADVARQAGDQILEKLKLEGVLTHDEAAKIWRGEMRARNG